MSLPLPLQLQGIAMSNQNRIDQQAAELEQLKVC